MAKIKMKYKEISKRVTQFAMLDISKLPEGEAKKNAEAFQLFCEAMVIPAGLKEYTDEMFGIYVLEAMVRMDMVKEKDEKQLKKVDSDMQKATKKFIAKKERETLFKKVLRYLNPIVWGKKGTGEVK